jgi:hypothetical protein
MKDFTVIHDNEKDRLKAIVEEIETIHSKGWLGFEEMSELERLQKELYKTIKEL